MVSSNFFLLTPLIEFINVTSYKIIAIFSFDNKLSGKIPSELANSRNLKQLLVAENKLVNSDEFSQSLLSNGASIDLNNPYVIPNTKGVIAIESEDEN